MINDIDIVLISQGDIDPSVIILFKALHILFQTDQIIAEYRARVRLYHPDKVPEDTVAGSYIFHFAKHYFG